MIGEYMKYFGYYIDSDSAASLGVSVAAVDKMTYIADTLISIGEDVDIISVAMATQGENRGRKINMKKNLHIRYFSSKHSKIKIINVILRYIFQIKLFFWTLINVKYKERIIIYHSLGYMRMFSILKAIKQFSIILEMEEIYADVLEDKEVRKREIQFSQKADAYIFPTQIMDKLINLSQKPSVIVHGVYRSEKEYNGKKKLLSGNNTIHCVYAGTFDPKKGGALAAIEACKYLPSNYHMHILGFGSDEDIKNIKKVISEIEAGKACKITYEGIYKGQEYLEFLQSCQIGLSTQKPEGIYNMTSFPSKILSYLSNGLHVVSIRIPVVEQSAVANLVTYYEKQTGQEIAKAIMSVPLKDEYDSKKNMRQLDIGFKEKLAKVIKTVE